MHIRIILYQWSSRPGAAETNLARNHEVAGLIPGPAQGVKDPTLWWAVGCRRGSDPAWLWLWLWLAATAPIPLGTSICLRCGPQKTKKKKKKKKKKEEKEEEVPVIHISFFEWMELLRFKYLELSESNPKS